MKKNTKKRPFFFSSFLLFLSILFYSFLFTVSKKHFFLVATIEVWSVFCSFFFSLFYFWFFCLQFQVQRMNFFILATILPASFSPLSVPSFFPVFLSSLFLSIFVFFFFNCLSYSFRVHRMDFLILP